MCISPIQLTRHKVGAQYARIVVPCGKCVACLKSRRDDWSVRLLEELKNHMDAVFVTLTYSDIKLNFIGNVPVVKKEDLQLFFKRLRKHVRFRYYACAEYGPTTFRPHYHAILFGLSKNQQKIIFDSWQNGNILVDEVNLRRIRYVSKYHVNKGIYPVGASPPFALMSRNPGIGSKYVEKMKNYHQGLPERCFYQNDSKKLHLPRYYREKLYTKEERQFMANQFNDKTYSEETIKEFNRINPNTNYFEHKLSEINNIIVQFKEKSVLNQKL